jgi:hypothetical protein
MLIRTGPVISRNTQDIVSEDPTDLNDETGIVPRVVVIHDTSSISDDLVDTTKKYGGHEAICSSVVLKPWIGSRDREASWQAGDDLRE